MIKYKNIIERLAEAGYTTYRIRNEKLISEGSLQNIRNGRAITTDTLNRICAMLQCQPGDVLEYEPDRPK